MKRTGLEMFPEKVPLELRSKGRLEIKYSGKGEGILGRGNNMGKGLEMGRDTVHWKGQERAANN